MYSPLLYTDTIFKYNKFKISFKIWLPFILVYICESIVNNELIQIMREIKKPGVNPAQMSALDRLLLEKKTGQRVEQEEQQIQSNYKSYEDDDFIEDDMESFEEEAPKKKKKQKKLDQQTPIENNLYKYQKAPQVKKAETNMDLEKESKDILDSLFNDTKSPIKPKNFHKSVVENQKDEFDVAVSFRKEQNANTPVKEQETLIVPTLQVQSNLQKKDKQQPKQSVQASPKKKLEQPTIQQPLKQSIQFSDSKQNQKSLLEKDKLSCYIFDLCEDHAHPGSVFMFGKVKTDSGFESVCVTVKNIQRQIFLVPKKEALQELGEIETFKRMRLELDSLMDKIYRGKAKDYKCKQVNRKYCFDLDIDRSLTTFLKVKYDFSLPQVPFEAKGQYYDFVLGQSYTALELLILKRKIKGPTWVSFLNFKSPQTKLSWCAQEFEIPGIESFKVNDKEALIPPMKLMGLQITFAKHPDHGGQEIIAISVVQVKNYQLDNQSQEKEMGGFSVIRPFQGHAIPYGFDQNSVVQNEFALINYFLAKVSQFDPDVLVGHYLYTEIFELLLHRMQKLGVTQASKLGRLKNNNKPKFNGPIMSKVRSTTQGRLVCDSFTSSKEVIKESDFSLQNLAENHLQQKYMEIEQVLECYQDDKSLNHLLENASTAAYISLQLMFKFEVLPLTKVLTNIAGNLWVKSLQNARAERNEMLLMHEFYKEKYLWPDKYPQNYNEEPEKKKAKYGGGLVLEPVPGLYERITLLLDFNSLYPSIIQEYSLCFTTVDRPRLSLDSIQKRVQEEDNLKTILPPPTGENQLRGILPRVIRSLVQKRKQVKGQMKNAKDETLYRNFDIKQKAIKLIANSIYGCLGFKNSRFFAQPIAALITRTGREILESTVKLVQTQLQFQIVYGDTDSIMVNSNTDQLGEAIATGNKIKTLINKNYKYLEIEIDGIFQPLLLLKKKKYASKVLTNLNDIMNQVTKVPEFSREIKGLDMVRRDWSDISKKCSDFALDTILSGKSKEEIISLIADYLAEVTNKIKNDEMQLKDFIITKQLTKQISEYKDAKQQPHVAVAQRMINQNTSKSNMVGHHVHYVVCVHKDSSNLADKAFSPKEFLNDKKEIDFEYYKNQQIMPCLSRLCSHLENNAMQQFAKSLGLDERKYQEQQDVEVEEQMQERENNEKVRNLEGTKFELPCLGCKKVTDVQFLFQDNVWGLICECKIPYHPSVVKNILNKTLKTLIAKYYDYQTVCLEASCNILSKQTRLKSERCMNLACQGRVQQKFNEKRIYNQVQFFKSLFDYAKLKECPPTIKDICNPSLKFIDTILESSKISLKSLLAPLA